MPVTNHNDGKHADTPPPANTAFPGDAPNNERCDPWRDEEREVHETEYEASPPRVREIREDDLVKNLRACLTKSVEHETCSIGVDALG